MLFKDMVGYAKLPNPVTWPCNAQTVHVLDSLSPQATDNTCYRAVTECEIAKVTLIMSIQVKASTWPTKRHALIPRR